MGLRLLSAWLGRSALSTVTLPRASGGLCCTPAKHASLLCSSVCSAESPQGPKDSGQPPVEGEEGVSGLERPGGLGLLEGAPLEKVAGARAGPGSHSL